MPAIREEVTSFPVTRQGVRNLDQLKDPVLPISGHAATRKTAGANVGETERMLSAGGGALLLGLGLGQGSLAGLGVALAGGALLYRGISGHCALYSAMGFSTAESPPPGTRMETAYRVA
jgi:hypothetical protein